MLGLIKKFGCLVAGVTLLVGAGANAENFPSKPVHILVPYAAGGAVDVLARTLGQSLAKTWGQQPVIDNRPGAGGIIASQALVQSPPDGYTLILVASGHPLNQFIYQSLPYDTFRDFTAISEIASSPLAILVAKKSPYANLGDLLAAARKDPDALSYGMSGNGTSAHLAGELLKYMAGVKIVAVPYKGLASAVEYHGLCLNTKSLMIQPGAGCLYSVPNRNLICPSNYIGIGKCIADFWQGSSAAASWLA
jgi:tripartite-type tricarboxylate transporter receptor subunit TctC